MTETDRTTLRAREKLRQLANEIGDVSSVSQRTPQREHPQMIRRLEDWRSRLFDVFDELAGLADAPVPADTTLLREKLDALVAQMRANAARMEQIAHEYPNHAAWTSACGSSATASASYADQIESMLKLELAGLADATPPASQNVIGLKGVITVRANDPGPTAPVIASEDDK